MLSLPTHGVFLGCNTNTTEMLYGTECSFSCKEGSVAMVQQEGDVLKMEPGLEQTLSVQV